MGTASSSPAAQPPRPARCRQNTLLRGRRLLSCILDSCESTEEPPPPPPAGPSQGRFGPRVEVPAEAAYRRYRGEGLPRERRPGGNPSGGRGEATSPRGNAGPPRLLAGEGSDPLKRRRAGPRVRTPVPSPPPQLSDLTRRRSRDVPVARVGCGGGEDRRRSLPRWREWQGPARQFSNRPPLAVAEGDEGKGKGKGKEARQPSAAVGVNDGLKRAKRPVPPRKSSRGQRGLG